MWGCSVDDTSRHNGQGPLSGGGVRRCNFCQGQISESFLFCPFCGKRISPRDGPQTRWYYSKYAVVIGLATLGPFALPMVWSNPRYSVLTKVIITVLTLAVTAVLVYILVIVCIWFIDLVRQLMNVH